MKVGVVDAHRTMYAGCNACNTLLWLYMSRDCNSQFGAILNGVVVVVIVCVSTSHWRRGWQNP